VAAEPLVDAEKPAVRIRLMSPLGHYPAADVTCSWAKLIVRDDIAFSAVLVNPLPDDWPCSDVEIFAPEEVLFLSSISLALPSDEGMVWTYPSPVYEDIPFTSEDGWLTRVLNEEDFLLEKARALCRGVWGTKDSLDYMARSNVPPPLVGGQPYKRHCIPLNDHVLALLLEVDVDAWLALRGLSALLRANMLFQHPEFGETAIMTLHVAMEVSFKIVQEELKALGNPNPSVHDAGAYVDSIFNPNIVSGRKYFEAWYEDRIKIIHPYSRFGLFPVAPLIHDDFFDLRPHLHDIFLYLLTGEKWTTD
jgi:hypothetical protein